MRLTTTILFIFLFSSTSIAFSGSGFQQSPVQADTTRSGNRDTTSRPLESVLRAASPDKMMNVGSLKSQSRDLDPKKLAIYPASSLQQQLKGQAAGVYAQESSGEPGTFQSMFIRGTSQPLISAREVFQTQPLVVLDGVPLVMEHPFAFDVQQFKFERIGPATNPLSIVNMDNLESVQVLKDVAAIAMYGPKGANGVIVLTTKAAGMQRKIYFNSYVGAVQPTSVTPINGQFENDFRQQFYDKYTTRGKYSQSDVYPIYLSDSLNNSYYGRSNWTDSYYKSSLVYSLNAGISGGNPRANFSFLLGSLKDKGVADETGLDRYNARFNINMRPSTWLTFSATLNANQMNRQRNRNVRDRLAQVNYIPDLSSPLPPNKERYDEYLGQLDKGFDKNRLNVLEGLASVTIDARRIKFRSSFGVDYNEGYRDIFNARTLLQSNNYASNYFGYTQRAFFDNMATFGHTWNTDHKLDLLVGSSFQYETYKYNYSYAYKGTNDFIKLNLLTSSLDPTVFQRALSYKILDKTRNNTVSFNGRGVYTFKEKYTFSVLLRADASSNQQPTNRWFYSPVVSAGWDIKKDFLQSSTIVSGLNLRASAGRIGRNEYFDNYAQGPQYVAYVGFTGNLITPGYNGIAALARPYSAGSVGYNLEWAYTDQVDLGVDASFAKNRIRTSLSLYRKDDKNQLLGVPTAAEYGYRSVYKNGMAIRNTGFEVVLGADIFTAAKKVSWTSSLNFNFNRNKLTALPDGLSQLAIGDKLLKVGESVDSYWLYTNEGIYNSDDEVPMNAEGKRMSYNAITLKAGDPRWKDINGDNVINNNDRTLQGHALPIVAGGFDNDFGYKKWRLGLNFYYNIGRDLINQEMANRFDFINREGLNDINSVKEITYWEKRGEYSRYPLYNPWSPVVPYQASQDLFLENASFLKLRTISLGFDLTQAMKKRIPNMERFYVYGSMNNVFTITKYTGQDPELVNYTGYDTGYGMQLPKSFLVGVKMSF